MTKITTRGAVLALVASFLITPGSLGQSGPSAQVAGPDPDLVLVDVTVSEFGGLNRERPPFYLRSPVRGLQEEAFRLFEDGVQQDVRYFSPGDEPLSIGVVFDISEGTRARPGAPSGGAREWLPSLFGEASNRTERDAAPPGADQILLIELSDGSNLMESASRMLATVISRSVHEKKVVVLISDTRLNNDFDGLKQFRDAALASDVQIYAVDLSFYTGPSLYREPNFPVPSPGLASRMGDLFEETGGAWLSVRAVAQLDPAMAELVTELKGQYVLGYRSSNAGAGGDWRDIDVRLDPAFLDSWQASEGREVAVPLRHRSGYFGP